MSVLALSRRFHGRFTRRRRLRRYVAVVLVAIAAVIGGGYYYLSRPERVGRIASDLLERLSSANVEIEAAHLTWDGVIDLREVELKVPGIKGEGARLFRAEQVLMKVDPWEAMQGRFAAQQMIFIRPTLTPTQLSETTFNYEVLQALRDKQAQETGVELPEKLPRVFIREARIEPGEMRDGEYVKLGSVPLTGGLIPLVDAPGVYAFDLVEDAERSALAGENVAGMEGESVPPLSMTGRFDLQDLSVQWKLSDFAFAPGHKEMLPRQIRQWWDLFEPSGSLPEVEFTYDKETGPRGMVKVQDVALTLPWVSDEEYEARMTGVSGTFRFEADRVHIENLVGQIEGEGLEYRIDGQVFGYSAESAFRVKVQTLPFQIPEKPRYMLALPVPVQKVFRNLSPVGWLRVSMELKRNQPGGELDYNGTATILSGRELLAELRRGGQITGEIDPNDPKWISRGAYHKFPYELTNCRGLLTFDRDAIEVKQLTGDTGNGGSATITGTIGPPEAGANAAVDVTITAVKIAFDDKLRNALPDRHGDAIGLFFHEPSWQRLREAGHFRTGPRRQADEEYRAVLAAQLDELLQVKAPDADELAALRHKLADVDRTLARPVFDLGGRGNVIVKITRGYGPGLKPLVHTSIDLLDANVVCKFFPYPIRVTGGRLIISPGRATLDAITLAGIHGGHGTLVGHVDLPSKDGDQTVVPDVHLAATDVPFDELLYDMFTPPQDRWLRDLHLAGRFDIAGDIYHNDERGKVDIAMEIELADASATPGGGAFTIEQLAGKVGVTLGKLNVRQITGVRNDAEFTLSGQADWTDRDKPTMSFRAEAQRLRFEDPVLDLIRPAMEAGSAVKTFWDERRPEGAFDAVATYAFDGGDQRDFNVTVNPRSLSFIHRDQRIGLIDTTGSVAVTPGQIAIRDLAGKYDGGDLTLNGTVDTTGELTADLALNARGERITAAARRALPEAVVRVIDALELDGAYEAAVQRIVLRPAATEGLAFDVNSTIKLSGAQAKLGLPMTQVNATVDLTARADVGDRWPRIDLKIAAGDLFIAERAVRDLSVEVRNTGPTDRLVVPKLAATAGGGRLGGTGAVALGSGDFQLQLALADARLADLINSDLPATDPAPAAVPANPDGPTGLVSASIALEGNINSRDSLRGRGDLLVRDGHLYGVPMAMGLLRISHLTLPVKDHFDSAAISYFLHDRKVELQRLQLKSRTMLMDGAGKLNLNDNAVDVSLTTSNPNGLKLGPVTELIDKFRDQLVTIRITGSLDDPDTRVQPLSGISNAWKDVFGDGPVRINE